MPPTTFSSEATASEIHPAGGEAHADLAVPLGVHDLVQRPEVLRVQERNVPLVDPLVILARHVKLLASSLPNSIHTYELHTPTSASSQMPRPASPTRSARFHQYFHTTDELNLVKNDRTPLARLAAFC